MFDKGVSFRLFWSTLCHRLHLNICKEAAILQEVKFLAHFGGTVGESYLDIVNQTTIGAHYSGALLVV